MTPKRSKELSKQDKDGNPIWLKPERSNELEEILLDLYLFANVTGKGFTSDMKAHEAIAQAITAIEKWAKEKYAPNTR